ncbi:hypothetical protein FN846DRAFT_1014021 [Sphaerosporella brunnea]|uniref:Uncharacterized protein n=1 Tax=Sphaerosporella brunnea TaxID=1250544 RepID=A0A5J5EX85_9PEZI|nr:hypothetical protein FN846DRAFT_1014021 [Sphaerosporella brunnea]
MTATNNSRPPVPVEDDAVADGHNPEECGPFPLQSDRAHAIAQAVITTPELAVTADTANTMQLDEGKGTTMEDAKARTDSDLMEEDISAIDDIETQLREGNRHDNTGSPPATTSLSQAQLMREMARLDDEFHDAYLGGSNMRIRDEETRPSDMVLELRARNAALREQLERQHEAMDRMSEIYLAFGEPTDAWVNAVARDVAAHLAGARE